MRLLSPLFVIGLLACGGCRQPTPTAIFRPPAATNGTNTVAVASTATPLAPSRAVPVAPPPFGPVVAVGGVIPAANLEAEGLAPSVIHAYAAEPVSLAADTAVAPQLLNNAAANPQPPLKLDLIQALETSLLQNPELTALRRNEGVSVGALGVAQTYPFNPFVQLQVTPLQNAKNGAGDGTTYHYVLLMQTLQLGRQQFHREENAIAALNSVRWNILQAELSNVAQTERLYFAALYQRGLRDLALANAQLSDQLLGVVEKRLEGGDVTGAEAAISRLDNRAARQQAKLAEANYQTALLDLRRQLNIPAAVSIDVVEGLETWTWLPSNLSEPGAAAAYVASRPDVMAARCDVAAARANVDLARGSRIPDLQIGPYYQRTESGTSYLGLRTQNDIPVWNNGVPLVRQREAEVRQRAVVRQQLQLRAQLDAESALVRYERALQMLAESDSTFTESFPAELSRLEQQYRAGDIDFLRVVTARTSLLQLRRTHLDLLNEVAQAAIAVTAATGMPPETILRSGPRVESPKMATRMNFDSSFASRLTNRQGKHSEPFGRASLRY